jgi:hypothetical protein
VGAADRGGAAGGTPTIGGAASELAAAPLAPASCALDIRAASGPCTATAPSDDARVLDRLRSQLAGLHPNGSCVVATENGCGTARAAVVCMKFTDKLVLYVSNGERLQLLDDLARYYTDPPLIEQLRPLPTSELVRRVRERARAHDRRRTSDGHVAEGAVGAEAEEAVGAEAMPEDAVAEAAMAEAAMAAEDGTAEAAMEAEGCSREGALRAAVNSYLAHPRIERWGRGQPLPESLYTRLLAALRTLRWPASSARLGVAADAYLVLTSRRSASECGTRHPHFLLRTLCEELVRWYAGACDDASFAYNAIAVTRNFVGSAHVDRFDTALQVRWRVAVQRRAAIERADASLLAATRRCTCEATLSLRQSTRRLSAALPVLTAHALRLARPPQLAVAFGDFSGGELCVEGESGDSVDVVDTRGRVAKVDGRRVHWVRAFEGGERFSLIFYSTA